MGHSWSGAITGTYDALYLVEAVGDGAYGPNYAPGALDDQGRCAIGLMSWGGSDIDKTALIKHTGLTWNNVRVDLVSTDVGSPVS